jgi:hypothetical protein
MPEQSDIEVDRAREILERAMKRVADFETIKENAGLYCILCLASFSKTVVGVAEDDVVVGEERRNMAIRFYAEQLAKMLVQDFERRRIEIEKERRH